MEHRAARILNWVSVGMLILFILLAEFTVTVWNMSRTALISDCVTVFILLMLFEWLEQYIPVHLITTEVRKGKIFLAEINGSRTIKAVNNPLLESYRIVDIYLDIIDEKGFRKQTCVQSKFSGNVGSVPKGNVYVAYDKEELGIVPTRILMSYPAVKHAVRYYENMIEDIHYLNVAYNHGYLIQTMKETMRKVKANHDA